MVLRWGVLLLGLGCGQAAPPKAPEPELPAPPAVVPSTPSTPTSEQPQPTMEPPRTVEEAAARCLQAGPASLWRDEAGRERAWEQAGPLLDPSPTFGTRQQALGLSVDRAGRPLVSFRETRDSYWVDESTWNHLDVRRLEGAAWTQLGEPLGPIDTYYYGGPGRAPALVMGADGRPLVALPERGTRGCQLRVYRWDEGAWTTLGEPLGAASFCNISDYALAVDPQGRPVVAWGMWDGYGPSLPLQVHRWEAGAWKQLGVPRSANPGASDFHMDQPSLGFDRDGQPLLAWEESAGGVLHMTFGIHVQRWTGAEWLRLGTVTSGDYETEGAGPPYGPSLAVDGEGHPWVAFDKDRNPVRRWNGAAWMDVHADSAGVHPRLVSAGGRLFLLSMELLASGQELSERRLVVRTWESGAWVAVGPPLEALPGNTPIEEWALSVDPCGLPVVAWIEFSRPGDRVAPGTSSVHVWRLR